MKTLRALLEEVKVTNLDTDEELDLEALADMDLDSLLGGEYTDDFNAAGSEEIDFDDGNAEEELTLAALADMFGSDTETRGNSFGNLAFDDGQFGDPDEVDIVDTEVGPDGLDGFGGGSPGDIPADESELDLESEDTDDALPDDEFDEAGQEPENTDFQGEIRTVRGANLVYKRKTEDGNFEELWIYNVGNDIKRETQIRRAILAGTDVDPSNQQSQDGNQYADTTTAGNVQFLHIVGLPQ